MKTETFKKVLMILETIPYFRKLETDKKEIIKSFLTSLEMKDSHTLKHSIRVGKYSYMIAENVGISQEKCEEIQIAGILHDIGKIGVRTDILKKPDVLTTDEYNEIKGHTLLGYKILRNLDFSDVILKGVTFHHKRYNLSGYPDELILPDQLVEANIIEIADAFDAMISKRVYKQALSRKHAIQELKRNRGTQFNPEYVDVFVNIVDNLKFINEENFEV